MHLEEERERRQTMNGISGARPVHLGKKLTNAFRQVMGADQFTHLGKE